MIIISHRGAAGLAPENTLAGIDEAIKAGVDKIEIDVQVTKDNRLVLFHDNSMYRITGKTQSISELTLKEVSTTTTHSGQPIPTLEEAIEHAGDCPLLLDCKGNNWPKLLASAIKKHNYPLPSVSSPSQQDLYEFRQLVPESKVYLSDLTKPLGALYAARTLGFNGVSLNFWTLNPLSYHYAKRYGLEIIAYTVNRTILARFLHFLYPRAIITTDFPNRLAKLSTRRRKK
jgi:glycerophosphoryl diester phosphodiesterase